MKYLALFVAIFLFPVPTFASPLQPPLSPEELLSAKFEETKDHFEAIVAQNLAAALTRTNSTNYDFESLEAGKKVFLPFDIALPGQMNIDRHSAFKKAQEAVADGLVTWKNGKYKLKANGGRSVYGKSKCGRADIVGRVAPMNDGNTKSFASLYFGATQTCALIEEIHTESSIEDPKMIEQLIRQNKLMMWDAQGRLHSRLRGWLETEDFPLRALMLAHRISVDVERTAKKRKIKNINIKGHPDFNSSVFVKIDGKPSYVEVLMAIAAYLGGYDSSGINLDEYSPNQQNTNHLIQSIADGLASSQMRRLPLGPLSRVPRVSYYGQLQSSEDAIAFIEGHLDRFQCVDALKQP